MDIPYFFRATPSEPGGLGAYLVEVTVLRQGETALAQAVARARAAAEQTTGEGAPVRYLNSFLVPGDQKCFHLFEGSSAEAVARAAQLAELAVEYVVEGIT